MKPNLAESWILLVCVLLYKTEVTMSRTTSKSKHIRITTNKGQSTTQSASLLDIPQNDVYNNQVEEDIDKPSLQPLDSYTREQKARLSWDILERNNAKKPNKLYLNSEKTILRGPTGPRGPPGAVMTKEDIAKEFKKMIKEAANKKAKKIISAQCPSCVVKDIDKDVLSFFYPGVDDKVRTITRAPSAFTTKLLSKVSVAPNKLSQLEKFQLTGSEYALIRGVPANFGMNGKFTVDKSGIYQFTATLNVHSRHKTATELRSNFVQVLICPNGECSQSDSNKNLIIPQYIHSMDSRQRFFTIQLTAMLELKKADYVSLSIKNACRRTIDIQAGSQMTGIMLSV